MTQVTFEYLWINGQWKTDATVSINNAGYVEGVAEQPSPTGKTDTYKTDTYISGLTLPGLASAHCHAFQRILPGWTQRARSPKESFWTWRDAMYAAATCMGREELEAVAARCYLDLLRGGYTGVAEFLYLHRLAKQTGAELDADAAICAAAARTGIALTLLPTLYQHSDFGGAPPTPVQHLFARSTAQFMEDWDELSARYDMNPAVTLGVAFHSLRAVDIDTIATVYAALQDDARCTTFHIHIAEQRAEVEACVRHFNRTPIALLAERGVLDRRWSLIHGTHANPAELGCIAAAEATLVLCPGTEADLGDGCLDLSPFLNSDGQIAIGSDSNIGCNAYAELRQLEWSQRWLHRRRNVLASVSEPAVADRLYRAALLGGWIALGKATLESTEPMRADFVTFGRDVSDWQQHPPENFLSTLVFESPAPQAQQVMVGGRWLIRDGIHKNQAEIEARYRAALMRIQPVLREALSTAMAMVQT